MGLGLGWGERLNCSNPFGKALGLTVGKLGRFSGIIYVAGPLVRVGLLRRLPGGEALRNILIAACRQRMPRASVGTCP